jgi:hypothetical protein
VVKIATHEQDSCCIFENASWACCGDSVDIYIYIYIYILEREPRISLDTPEAYTGLRKIGILERGGGGGKKARMTIKHSHAR